GRALVAGGRRSGDDRVDVRDGRCLAVAARAAVVIRDSHGDGVGAVVGVRVRAGAGAGAVRLADGAARDVAVAPVDGAGVGVGAAGVREGRGLGDRRALVAGGSGRRNHRVDVGDRRQGAVAARAAVVVSNRDGDGVGAVV